MAIKPTYEELEQRVKDLEREAIERNRIEMKLKDREETLRALLNAPTETAVLVDLEGTILAINEVARQRFGKGTEELIGAHMFDYFSPDVAASRKGKVDEVVESGKPVRFPDERAGRCYDNNYYPVFDVEGKKVVAIAIYARDITESKRAEEALKEEASMRRILVEQSRDGIVVVDQNGKVYEANQRYADMLGYSIEEVHQLYLWDWDTQWTREELLERARTVDETGDHFETRHRRKDGTYYDVEISTNGAVIGGQKLVFCVCRDITQRKQAEEALKEANNIINRSPAVAFLWKNAEGWPVEFVSDNVNELFGYTAEEFTSGKITYAKTVHPDDLERVGKEVAAYIEEKDRKEFTHKPYRIICKNGEVKWLDDMTFIRRDEEGNITHFQGIVLDISDRIRAQEERRRVETQLQQAQKMEAIGTLAGGVAHDLNNILSGIVSYPDLMLMDLPEDSPLRKPILTMKKSGERAAVIVQDLLTLARRGVAIAEVVNLNDIIPEQLNSPEFEKLKSFHLNIEVEIHLEKDLLNIKGSSAHLSKTIMNLIYNAAEAMPDGGKILISTENRYIDRPVRGYDHIEEGEYVIIKVSDSGVGISEEDMQNIFEPFYTRKVMGRSGTGLGMAVVWGTVKDHKGYIDVKSSEGKGTTFTLYFPAIREKIVKDESLLAIEDYMGRGESILVVDDIEEQRELASIILHKLGYSVSTVSSGEEAVEYLKENPADLLVLDMIMDPGIDGLETYKRIVEFHPNQKAIITSGFSETDRVKEVQRLGGGQYIKKPYTLEKIGLAIKNELEN
jgi:PAS domain S-box-containing protein